MVRAICDYGEDWWKLLQMKAVNGQGSARDIQDPTTTLPKLRLFQIPNKRMSREEADVN